MANNTLWQFCLFVCMFWFSVWFHISFRHHILLMLFFPIFESLLLLLLLYLSLLLILLLYFFPFISSLCVCECSSVFVCVSVIYSSIYSCVCLSVFGIRCLSPVLCFSFILPIIYTKTSQNWIVTKIITANYQEDHMIDGSQLPIWITTAG